MLRKREIKMGAAIAQWIRLRLPPCRPGSTPKNTPIHVFLNKNGEEM